MAKNTNFVSHKKSKQKNQDGTPQLPLASALVEGEIAINFAENVETLSIKNESGNVVTFSSDNYYSEKKLGSAFTGANSAVTVTEAIEENEEIIATALNDLNERKLDASAYTPTDLSNYYTKSETSGKTELSTAFNGKQNTLTASTGIDITNDVISVDADQVIDNTTSASTNAVSTSAVYGFVTSYTPSITVDQVLDNTTSASTNPVSSKAVYDAVTDNELVWTNAYVAMSGVVSSHTENTNIHLANGDREKIDSIGTLSGTVTAHTADTNIHLTTTEKGQLHTHSNKTYIDSITGTVGTMAYEDKASYSSATEVNTALVNKANTSDLASYADSVKYNSTSHYVEFYHGTTAGTKVFEYDASPFIIDGMVQNVEIKDVTSGGSQVTCLVISFNTDAGKQDINVPISDIFDANNYYQKSETSGATEISNALDAKANTSDFNTHTADTNVHFTTNDRLKWETLNRRTRKNFTNSGMTYFINTLKSAIADQDLEKYGLKVGDYYTVTHDGKTYNYVIAGLNTMRGTSTPYRLNYDHVGIIVDTNDTHAWNTSNSTTTSQNTHLTGGTWTSGASAGYASCDLQYYLETTVLPNVESDLGSDNVKSHSKLYSNAVNTNGYNRFGSAGGCSSSWTWYSNQKICALSEVQVYGSIVWSSSGYDTGEACRQLDVFRVYNMNEIFESRYPWLRDVASSSYSCHVSNAGAAYNLNAAYYCYVAALILFA